MTQLVELRDAYPRFEAAGIKLYAISYDNPKELAEFASHHDIPYPLLSDRGSKLIRQLGILNTNVTPDQVPFYGIPFPGTYMLDEDGITRAKFFHRNLAARHAAESMLDSALGEILLVEGEPMDSTGDDDIRITAAWHGGGGTMKAAVIRELVVRFELAEGLHVYDDPVPQGMVAVRIEVLGPPGVHTGEMRKPPTHPLDLPGLDKTLQVWDGQVDFVMPAWVDQSVVGLVDDLPEDAIEVSLRVHYQACDDQVCHIPQARDLTLKVPAAAYVAPNMLKGVSSMAVSTMDSQKYMKRKVLRGLLRSPLGGIRFIRETTRAIKAGPMSRSRRPK